MNTYSISTTALAIALGLSSFSAFAAPPSIVVNTPIFSGSDGDCSLTEAVEAATTKTAVDGCVAGKGKTPRITFDSVALGLPGTMYLEDIAVGPDGLLINSAAVEIEGPGAGQLTLDAINGPAGRHFRIIDGGSLTLSGIRLSNGDFGSANGGGAISVEGGSTLNLSDAVLDNNTGSRGGAIRVIGSVASIADATFSGNLATSSGGAIDITSYITSGAVIVSQSDFFGNIASGGGAIAVTSSPDEPSTLNVEASGFYANIAAGTNSGDLQPHGGAIRNWANGSIAIGVVTISNSTFGLNTALLSSTTDGNGGGVSNYATNSAHVEMTISDSVFLANDAIGVGKDIYSGSENVNATDTLTITNTVYDDCEGCP